MDAQRERAGDAAREMSDWAANKGIEGILRGMYSNIVVSRPTDVFQFMIDSISKSDARPQDELLVLLKEVHDCVIIY